VSKLAIFDMDGTLFNTNDINYYAYKEALDKYNVSIDYDYYCKFCNGRHYTVFIPPLVDNNKAIVEDIHKIKKEAYSKYLEKVKINNKLIDIIKSIKKDYKIAIVTTASKKNTNEILEYTKTQKLFDLILTAEDIKEPKPDPEGFIKAMKYFNVKSDDCMIFEDSDVGIESALQTGSSVFRIIDF